MLLTSMIFTIRTRGQARFSIPERQRRRLDAMASDRLATVALDGDADLPIRLHAVRVLGSRADPDAARSLLDYMTRAWAAAQDRHAGLVVPAIAEALAKAADPAVRRKLLDLVEQGNRLSEWVFQGLVDAADPGVVDHLIARLHPPAQEAILAAIALKTQFSRNEGLDAFAPALGGSDETDFVAALTVFREIPLAQRDPAYVQRVRLALAEQADPERAAALMELLDAAPDR